MTERKSTRGPGLYQESEADFTRSVIALAKTLGWAAAHFRPAQTVKGWRTAVSGDGVGFPDLVLVRQDGSGPVIFAELKAERGKLSRGQETWQILLMNRPGVQVYTWYPSQWEEVVELLR